MTFTAKDSPVQRAVAGADETLPTIRLEMASGNFCDLTAGVKHLPEDKCRMLMSVLWKTPPNDEERDASNRFITDMMGRPANFIVSNPTREIHDAESRRFLEHGERPLMKQ